MSARTLFSWLRDLVADLPIVTPRDPDPPFYDDIPTGPEHDRRALAEALTSGDDPELVVELGVWLADLDAVAERGHELAYRAGVASGEIEASAEWGERTTDQLPVLFAARWQPGELPGLETAGDDRVGPDLALELPHIGMSAPAVELGADELASRSGRRGWIAGAVGAALGAAVTLAVCLGPASDSTQPAPMMAQPLQVTEQSYATCEPAPTALPTRAAGTSAPGERTIATEAFGPAFKTLRVRSPDTSATTDYGITVERIPRDRALKPTDRVIELDPNLALEVGIGDLAQMVLEP